MSPSYSNLFTDGLDIKYSMYFEILKKKDGKDYIQNLKPKVNFTVKKANFHFDNLFDGDKTLGKLLFNNI